MAAHFRSRPLLCVVCLLLAFLSLGLAHGARGQDLGARPLPASSRAALEQAAFVGVFGVEDDKDKLRETFTFKDGKFTSASCLEWGFPPAPYWTRRDGEGIHFLAELKSNEHGTMRFEGIFDGRDMTALAYWKKERWYWTVQRTYRFKGRRAGTVK